MHPAAGHPTAAGLPTAAGPRHARALPAAGRCRQGLGRQARAMSASFQARRVASSLRRPMVDPPRVSSISRVASYALQRAWLPATVTAGAEKGKSKAAFLAGLGEDGGQCRVHGHPHLGRVGGEGGRGQRTW
jgi:hypothetical protein